jgi:hypothetical protein
MAVNGQTSGPDALTRWTEHPLPGGYTDRPVEVAMPDAVMTIRTHPLTIDADDSER